MCDWCYLHTGRPWYLDKRFHDVKNAPGWLQMVANFMAGPLGSFVEDSTKALEKKVKPYNALQRVVYEFVSRDILGAQVVAGLDEALQIVDTANDVFLHRCNCMRGINPEHPEVQRCIFLNHAATYTRKNRPEVGTPHDPATGKFVDPEVAKEIIKRERQEGHFTQVMYSPRPYVDCICNCDQWCGRWKVPELPWANTPSFKMASPYKADECNYRTDECDKCTNGCYAHAISVYEDREGHHVDVDQEKCIGCGLCVEKCPEGVFKLEPRKKIWDPVVLKVIEQNLYKEN